MITEKLVRNIRYVRFVAVLLLPYAIGGGAARAQTIVNLTNFDPTLLGDASIGSAALQGSTNLDTVNTAGAGSAGGLFPASVSQVAQTGGNQLNVLGMLPNGGVAAVVLGTAPSVPAAPGSVTINTVTSAVPFISGSGSKEGYTSLTIANTNVASNLGPLDKAILDVSAPGGGAGRRKPERRERGQRGWRGLCDRHRGDAVADRGGRRYRCLDGASGRQRPKYERGQYPDGLYRAG